VCACVRAQGMRMGGCVQLCQPVLPCFGKSHLCTQSAGRRERGRGMEDEADEDERGRKQLQQGTKYEQWVLLAGGKQR